MSESADGTGRRQLLAAGALSVGVSALSLPLRAASAAPLRRIGFGSCVDQQRPAPIWQAILDAHPDFFIFGGDNVYAAPAPWHLQALEAAYTRQAQEPVLARLRAQVPHLAIWDDNDYGLNDGGAEFPHKAQSKAAFLKFWNVPAQDPRRHREGLYTAEIIGPPGQRVQIIMLDLRWFRSPWTRAVQAGTPGQERYRPDEDPRLSLLGEAQWRWLEAQLRLPAELRLIVSPIQVVVEGHGYERWGNFPRERQRLYELIAATGAEGVVLLSGDRHIGAVYREARGVPYPLYELTASGLNKAWAAASEPGPNRLGELLTVNHFGLVEIDWTHRQLALELLDEQGQLRRRELLDFDQIRPARR